MVFVDRYLIKHSDGFVVVNVDSLELEIGVTVVLIIGVDLEPDRNEGVLLVEEVVYRAVGAEAKNVVDVGGKSVFVINDNRSRHVRLIKINTFCQLN